MENIVISQILLAASMQKERGICINKTRKIGVNNLAKELLKHTNTPIIMIGIGSCDPPTEMFIKPPEGVCIIAFNHIQQEFFTEEIKRQIPYKPIIIEKLPNLDNIDVDTHKKTTIDLNNDRNSFLDKKYGRKNVKN